MESNGKSIQIKYLEESVISLCETTKLLDNRLDKVEQKMILMQEDRKVLKDVKEKLDSVRYRITLWAGGLGLLIIFPSVLGGLYTLYRIYTIVKGGA